MTDFMKNTTPLERLRNEVGLSVKEDSPFGQDILWACDEIVRLQKEVAFLNRLVDAA